MIWVWERNKDGLEDRLLVEISKSFPFSLNDVKSVYINSGYSIDKTIDRCQIAVHLGLSSPVFIPGIGA